MSRPVLAIHCSGSAFRIRFDDVRRWRGVLDCACALALEDAGREVVRVELAPPRRWIAYTDGAPCSPLYAVGYQTTVGAVSSPNGVITGGSNFKVIAEWAPGEPVRVVTN